jgi:uncharacterized protein
VSASNHGWSTHEYIAALPVDAVEEIHLAGHSTRTLDGGRVILIDDHASRVRPEVWTLYEQALARFGAVPTLIEWDNDIPDLDALVTEARQADAYLERITPNAGCALAA